MMIVELAWFLVGFALGSYMGYRLSVMAFKRYFKEAVKIFELKMDEAGWEDFEPEELTPWAEEKLGGYR